MCRTTPGYITCDNISEKVWIVICCGNELRTDPHVNISLFLHSIDSTLANAMHLQNLTGNGVATTNCNFNILCYHLYSLITIWAHNLLHLSHNILVPWCFRLYAICRTVYLLICDCPWTCDATLTPWTGTSVVCHTLCEASAVFPSLIFAVTGKIWCLSAA